MKEFEHNGQAIPKGRRFCTCCGEIKRESAFEGDSTHCMACCEKMLHTRVHASGFAVSFVLVCAAVFAALLIPKGVAVNRLVQAARLQEAQGRLYSACDTYAAAIDCAQTSAAKNSAQEGNAQADDAQEGDSPVFFTPGRRIWREFGRAYARAYTRTEAADFAESHLDRNLIRTVQPFSSYMRARSDYNSILSQVQNIDAEYTYQSASDMPYDKIADALDAFVAKHDSANMRGYAAYFKASAAWFHDPADPQSALALYDQMLENVPDEYVSAYTGIAQIGQESGDADVLLRAAEGILTRNKEHAEAWSWKVQAQVVSGDTDAAAKTLAQMRKACPDSPLCDAMTLFLSLRGEDVDAAKAARDAADKRLIPAGEQVFNTLLAKRALDDADARFLRESVRYQLYAAAVSLLEKDVDAALACGYERAFNYAYYYASITGDGSVMTQSVFNMAALCANRAADEEAVDTIAQIGDCDSATSDVLQGKISLKDAFCKGKAVIL